MYDRAIVYSCGRLVILPFESLQFLSRRPVLTDEEYNEMVSIAQSRAISVKGITKDSFENCTPSDPPRSTMPGILRA